MVWDAVAWGDARGIARVVEESVRMVKMEDNMVVFILEMDFEVLRSREDEKVLRLMDAGIDSG